MAPINSYIFFLLLQKRKYNHPPKLLLSPGREHQNPWVCFLELWWPILLFRKMPFFPGQPSISMEIETSFSRGPLLTCSSHISAREPVPRLCSEQRGYIYPVSWQVVPKEPLHWTLSPQNVKQRANLDSPSQAWMSLSPFSFLGLMRTFQTEIGRAHV